MEIVPSSVCLLEGHEGSILQDNFESLRCIEVCQVEQHFNGPVILRAIINISSCPGCFPLSRAHGQCFDTASRIVHETKTKATPKYYIGGFPVAFRVTSLRGVLHSCRTPTSTSHKSCNLFFVPRTSTSTTRMSKSAFSLDIRDIYLDRGGSEQ